MFKLDLGKAEERKPLALSIRGPRVHILGSNLERLFTVATAHATGCVMDFYVVEN